MKHLLSALFVVSVGAYGMSSGCSPSSSGGDAEGGSAEGGSGGKGGKGGGTGGTKSGGSTGTGGSKTGGVTGTGGSGTGGSAVNGGSGGSGGTGTGGTAGSTAGAGGSAMGGAKSVGGIYGMADPGPYVMPFTAIIPPGTFTATQGTKTFDGGNTCCIGGVDEGDWTRYAAVNFGGHCGYDKFTVKYATPNDGGIVEVHIDSLDGPVIAQVNLTKTGPDFGTGGEASGPIIPVAGSHELVVRFLGVTFGIGNFTGFSMTASGARMKCVP